MQDERIEEFLVENEEFIRTMETHDMLAMVSTMLEVNAQEHGIDPEEMAGLVKTGLALKRTLDNIGYLYGM